MAESGKSITWIIAAVMIVVALFGWGFLAGSYNGAHAGKYRELEEMSEEEIKEYVSKLSEEELKELEDSYAVTPSGGSFRSNVRGGGIGQFIGVAFAQLPNFPAVIGWHFTNRIWLPILLLVLEFSIFFGGFKMKALEKQLAKPYRSRK